MAESKEVALITNQEELVTAVSAEWGRSKDEIKAMISVSFPTLKTVGQLVTAFTAAKKWDLDPQAKEIYAYVDFRGNMALIVGKDGFLKIARKQTGYKQIISASVFLGDDFEMNLAEGTITKHIVTAESLKARTGNPIGAYAILRMEGLPDIIKWAEWSEYAQAQGPWTKQKSAMICKCATSTLIREAFGVSGLYDEAEVSPEGSFDNTAYIEPEKVDKFKRVASPKTPKVEEKTETVETASADVKIETPVVEEAVVEEIIEKTPVTYISDEQSSKITNLFTQLGYDLARIDEKTESLERQLGKPYDQFTIEEAGSIIANMTKALKKQEEDKPKEVKKSAVGAIGEKVKAEQEAIKNSEEFKAAFPEEEQLSEAEEAIREEMGVDMVEEVFGEDEKADQAQDSGVKTYDDMSEVELKEELVVAKAEFKKALENYRADGSNISLAERTRCSAVCSDINKVIISKGYALV